MAFALDLSDLSAKFLLLKKKGKFFEVVSFGEQKIKEGILREGVIKNEEKLAEILKEGKKNVKGKKISTNYCFATLPEEKAFFFTFELPKMKPEDLRSALVYQVENAVPLPAHKIYFDFEVVEEREKNLKVLIGAMEKEIVDSYLSTLKKAGFFPLALEVECQSIQRALIPQTTEQKETLLILDLGATKTTLVLLIKNKIALTKSIPIGGNLFDQQIAKSLKIKKEEAEKLKMKYGLGEELAIKFSEKEVEKTFIKNRIFEILIPSLTSLVEETKVFLDFFQTHYDGKISPEEKKISKVIISGGQAQMVGLKEFLETELNLPIEVGNPAINSVKFPKSEEFKGLSYATAVGLALRNFYD